MLFGVTGVLSANVIDYFGAGTDLNVATFDDMNNVVVGVTTLTIAVPDVDIVDPGDSVTVSLMGLQYPWVGDLQATLSFAGTSGDVFNQIGLDSTNPVGSYTQFGDSGTIDAGNYVFGSVCPPSGPSDIWATADGLSYADSIPSGCYWPTTALFPDNDNLSSQFDGLPTTGLWVLTITDYYPPDPYSGFTPGITEWELTIDTTPEPSTAIPVALAGLLWCIRSRRRAANSR